MSKQPVFQEVTWNMDQACSISMQFLDCVKDSSAIP